MTQRSTLQDKSSPKLAPDPLTEKLFPGLTLQRSLKMDTITWANGQIPKHQLLYLAFVIGLIVVAGIGLFLTIRLFDDLYGQPGLVTLRTSELVISSFFVGISWLGVGGIAYQLVRLSWIETIQISDAEICLAYRGLFAPKAKCIPADRIWCLSFERVGNERDQETRFTLNLFDIDDKRLILAYWIRAEENYQLFLLLERIFAQRQWLVQSRSNFRVK